MWQRGEAEAEAEGQNRGLMGRPAADVEKRSTCVYA